MGCGAARFTIGPTVAHPTSSSTAHPDPIAAATGAVPGAPAATTDPLNRAEVHPEKDAPVSVSVCGSTDMEKGVENEVGITTEQLGNNLAALPNDARRRSAGMPIDWGTKADTSAEADFVSTEYGSSPVEQEPLETEMAGLPNDACTQSRDLPTDVEPEAKIEDDRRVAACSSTEDSRGYNHSAFLAKLSGAAAAVSAAPFANSEIRQPDVKVEEDGRKSPTVEELMNEIAPADEQLEKECLAAEQYRLEEEQRKRDELLAKMQCIPADNIAAMRAAIAEGEAIGFQLELEPMRKALEDELSKRLAQAQEERAKLEKLAGEFASAKEAQDFGGSVLVAQWRAAVAEVTKPLTISEELRAMQKVSRMRNAIMPENVDLVQDAQMNRQDSPSVDDLVAEVASIPR